MALPCSQFLSAVFLSPRNASKSQENTGRKLFCFGVSLAFGSIQELVKLSSARLSLTDRGSADIVVCHN
jgi:hypothetical protein